MSVDDAISYWEDFLQDIRSHGADLTQGEKGTCVLAIMFALKGLKELKERMEDTP